MPATALRSWPLDSGGALQFMIARALQEQTVVRGRGAAVSHITEDMTATSTPFLIRLPQPSRQSD
jgi:hypothetical protein